MKHKIVFSIFAFLLVLGLSGAIGFYYFNLPVKEAHLLYFSQNESSKVRNNKLRQVFSDYQWWWIQRIMQYKDLRVAAGRYSVEGLSALDVLRVVCRGNQTPMTLTIPIVHTKERLAAVLAQRLDTDSADFAAALNDSATCAKYGYAPDDILCMVLPNTYEVYWTYSAQQWLDRMQRESRRYWTAKRKKQAEAIGLTPTEVYTLASIVEQESKCLHDLPIIAGLYINRIKKGMCLQADPTLKFACRDFKAQRVKGKMLSVDSPYNTYIHTGLPPGPICIPSMASIEAVLHYQPSRYLYMCASPQLDGTHRFTHSYSEHLRNARAYTRAITKMGIK